MSRTEADAGMAVCAADLPTADERDFADESRRSKALRGRHRLVLIGAAFVLLGSLVLETVGNGRIAVRGLGAYPLPHTCAARMLFERGCPACGLTRSFIHLANGRWQQSVSVHRLGWLLALLLALQIPYRIAGLVGSNPLPLGSQLPAVVGWTMGILFVANWCYSLLV